MPLYKVANRREQIVSQSAEQSASLFSASYKGISKVTIQLMVQWIQWIGYNSTNRTLT